MLVRKGCMAIQQTKRILVTGGAGFLGRHLCRRLAAENHQVTVLDLKENPEFSTIIADITDLNAMLEHITGYDVVFHLAALIEAGESVKHPQRFVDVNISATVNVLEAMRTNGVNTFIFSSSAAVYGEPLSVPISEDDRTLPINPYGMTKLAMEGLVNSYVASHKMTGVGLRYFNLYGPEEHHEPESHAMPRFIKQIYTNQEVTVWGSGEHKRDYIHVADVVDAHLKAMTLCDQQPEQYHYFNISTEKPSSTLDIVHAIEKALNTKANVKHFPARPGDPLLLYADAQKAHEQLQWHAQKNIEQGVKETVEYFVEYWKSHAEKTVET